MPRPRKSPGLLKVSVACLTSLSPLCLSSVGSFQIPSEGIIIRAASFLSHSNSHALHLEPLISPRDSCRGEISHTYQASGVLGSPSLSPVCTNRKLSPLFLWNMGLSLGKWLWESPGFPQSQSGFPCWCCCWFNLMSCMILMLQRIVLSQEKQPRKQNSESNTRLMEEPMIWTNENQMYWCNSKHWRVNNNRLCLWFEVFRFVTASALCTIPTE